MSPGYQKCQLLTLDSGEWRQLLYIKKTALVFTCLAYNRYDIHQIRHMLEEMPNKASRFLDRYWPLADCHFGDFSQI